MFRLTFSCCLLIDAAFGLKSFEASTLAEANYSFSPPLQIRLKQIWLLQFTQAHAEGNVIGVYCIPKLMDNMYIEEFAKALFTNLTQKLTEMKLTC